MLIVRFNAQGKVKYGALEDNIIRGMQDSPFTQFKGFRTSYKLDNSTYKLDEVKLLAPCTPSKVVCVGGNHMSHSRDLEKSLRIPLMFDRPSTAVIGPDDTIKIPPVVDSISYEGELALVIGKRAKDVPEKDWEKYVMGFTCHNDVAASFMRGSHTRGKGYDTFAPIGPCINTDVDWRDLNVVVRINDEIVQDDSTKGTIAKVPRLINYYTSIMTFLPGDVISTGTPGKMGGSLKPGDVVTLTIEKIGTLKNLVGRRN